MLLPMYGRLHDKVIYLITLPTQEVISGTIKKGARKMGEIISCVMAIHL